MANNAPLRSSLLKVRGGAGSRSFLCASLNQLGCYLLTSILGGVSRWAPWCGGEAPRAGGGGAEGRGGAKGEVPHTPCPTPPRPSSEEVRWRWVLVRLADTAPLWFYLRSPGHPPPSPGGTYMVPHARQKRLTKILVLFRPRGHINGGGH